MRSLLQRGALVLGAFIGLLGTRPATANAQKALVYCPVSIDATGCNSIVTALTGPAYPLGVDRGYDGTDGTVDLKAVDLFSYSVFVVPSLADDSTSQPYAKLRDPEVVEHLKAALIGRIAMWSGTPDQGATNRAMKDALLQNLAGWAGGAFATAKGPGLVALLDASADVVSRYGWVRAITPVPVTSDPALSIYNNVRALSQRATTILTSGAGAIVYDNMATFGFQLPNGAPGVNLDAVGQTGTSQGGQIVLITMEAGNSSGALVKTDKADYAPGETVTITGTGWQANETVKLTLHMDPLRDADTELTATADGNGNFTNTDFAPGQYDVGVRFVLTATGQASGRRAQTTFTDGNKVTFSTTAAGADVSTFGSIPQSQCFNAFVQERQGNNLDVAPTGGRLVTLSSTAAGATFYAGAGCAGASVPSVTIPAGQPSVAFSFVLTTVGAQTINGNAGFTGSSNASATATVTGPANVATTLTLSAPSPASVTYGSTGTVTLTSTLTRTTGGAAVVGATVTFTVDAVSVGTGTTNASGVATLSYNPASLAAGSHTIGSSFTAATIGGTSYLASTSGTQTLTVNTRPITVTADPKAKGYGDVDPVLTYQITSGSLAAGDAFSGALARAAGESVGIYAIQKGTLALSANYVLTYVGASLTITTRAVTVTADPKTKVYGDADPTLTYQITSGSLAFADAFSGALTRVAGNNVGTFAIQQGTLALNANYVLTYVGANLTITGRLITVTADAKSKIYGDADPAFTYQITSGTLATGDAISGALSRVAGENVGAYAIQQGTLSAGNNYALTFVGANLSVTTRAIAVTADPQTKVYGNTDPALTYKVTTGSLVNGDAFSGSLSRATGESVGTYAIAQGTLSAGTNYALTFVGANLTITTRAVTVTADLKTKVYGDADPALTYQITTGSLAFTDVFSGALSRATGENLGAYAIQQGTLALSTNYVLTYVGANLTITARPITVKADPKTKVYGDADPQLTYQITSGSLAFEDQFVGSISRGAGENVGSYAITQGTLALSTNYTLTFVPSTLTITKRQITVTANPQTKVYGNADPAFTYAITSGNLVGSDALTGTLSRASGEDVGSYAITQGALTAGGNYDLTFAGALLTITKRAVTVTAAAKTKTYGDSDPALTYAITTGSLAFSDAFSGALARDAGENVGTYAIVQGTLTLGGNYDLTFAGANLTITKRAVAITADAKTKTYGDPDPTLTYHISSGSLAFSDAFTGSLTRVAGENVGSYAIQQNTVALNPTNYDLTYNGANLTIDPRAVTVTADAKTKVYGESDPAFTYQITTGNLVGSDAFSGALTRAAGENAGTHAITQGTLALSTNYALTYVGANLTITSRPISITADAKSKTYGDADPALTYQITSGSLAFSDAFSGALTRVAGENVGAYAINQGTVTLSTNYTLSYAGANLTIIKRLATWTTQPATKVFGAADPVPLTTGSGSNFLPGDGVAATYSRAAGETVMGGPYAITATLSSAALGALSNYTITNAGAPFTITKATPAISWTGMPSSMNQGAALSAAQLNAYAVPVSGPGQVAGTMSYTLLPSTTVSVGTPVYGVGGYSVKATFAPTDQNYYGNEATTVLTLLNVAPVVTSITLPGGAVPLGAATSLAARFTDAGLTDTHTFSIDWDWDIQANAKTPNSYTSPWAAVPAASEPTASTQGTVTGSYTYPAAGVYTIRVTVKDNSGDTGSKTSQTELFAYVVVYDASGGFVTGGGWINSPAGACLLTTACGGAVGKANFGFVAKYKKGQSTPDGNTEFQFQAGNLNFSSTSYDWLVVAGSKAQYKGVGTINGGGTYGFILTATDNASKDSPDTFRMKIWIKNANGTDGPVVYDNQMGAPDDGTPTTVLGGGSIQIHQ